MANECTTLTVGVESVMFEVEVIIIVVGGVVVIIIVVGGVVVIVVVIVVDVVIDMVVAFGSSSVSTILNQGFTDHINGLPSK